MPPSRRFPRFGAGLVTLTITIGFVVGAAPAPFDAQVAEAAPTERFLPAAGPLGPISVIGDSVLHGSMVFSPTLADTLAQRGWGPVRMRTGEGYSTGYWAVDSSYKVSNWIQIWRQQGWDPVDVVVNLGANDSGFAMSDSQRAYEAIMHLVDAIGPGHRIWWPKITRFYTHQAQQNAWNEALDRVDAERSDFWTWDWPSEMLTGGYASHDMTHLAPDSYRQRSRVMAREITADLAYARDVGGDAPLPQAIGGPAEFVPLPPERVFDTRAAGGAPPPAATRVEIDMKPLVPSGTTAVAVNLTTDQASAGGFLTGYPCDRDRREVSNVNHEAWTPRGALAVVPLSADGRLCVYTHANGHVIVDLQGAFVPGSSDGLRFTPLATPTRVVDTRESGRATILEVPMPADAVAVNLTATGATEPGWLKAFPCGGTPPDVSNVNYGAGETVASAAFVPVSGEGTICVQSHTSVDVVVDVTGVFETGAGLRFVPADPTRMLDTRVGIGGWSPYIGAGQMIHTQVVPEEAQAVTGTITLVAPLRPGFLKAYPCADEPGTSSVNAATETVFANAVTVGVNDDGRLCIKSHTATHALFDVSGWWIA
jgi:hypothetical protein